MLRRVIAAFFLIAFSMQTFSKAVIAINFYANQTEITQTLCENKDKPQLNCCGKCQLKKRISKQDKADDKERERKSENKNEVTSLACCFPEYNFSPSLNQLDYFDITASNPIDRAANLFRPPSV